ncbi:zinc phosphodiesterase ELAC protein 1-like [Haliotis rufescens]|uniref:zinc phosphodiesterase ELAC protein 1-like n=1 Tax=Haliotis rufescens TaxID=6454 RepID=UPI001EB084D3|nr:zinc phosphodiesterase ELAC protein 1-like [Haliotis rufescens]
MEITFLGTASAYPTPSRGVSCVVLKHDNWCWMFDCGEGSQIQLMKSPLKPGKISKIFISHLHGDHCFGLPGLMCTISQNNARTEPVELYGPLGLRKFLRVSLELSRSQLGFDYIVHELQVLDSQLPADWMEWTVDHAADEKLHPNEKAGRLISPDENGVWQLFNDGKFHVQGVQLQHRVPSFGFAIQEAPQPGRFDVQAAKSLGIPPGPLYSKLKSGEAVVLEDGTKVDASEVVGPSRPGRHILVMGDTSDSSEVVKVGRGADVLIHEATLENALWEKCLENGHSTPAMAAELAQQLDVGQLILTHFSQRYRPLSYDAQEGEDSVKKLLEEAENVLGKGKVICAEDMFSYTVPMKKT